MKNALENTLIQDYNNIILNVNNFIISDKDNPYGHIKEFNKLNKNVRMDAHRVISFVAIKMANIENLYSVTDINGNTYDIEIFGDTTYRVVNIEIFNNNVEEVLNEKYIKTNS